MNTKKLLIILGCSIVAGAVEAQCPPNTNNLLQGSATVCAAANAGKVYVGNLDFTAQEWFYSHNNQDWMVTVGNGDTLAYANLTQTTYYRATVKHGTCAPVLSNTITVTVNAISDAGTLTGTSKGCRYTHSGTLTLENYTGNVQQWLAFDTLTNVWTSAANATNQYAFVNLATETHYKAIVKNGVCTADTSAAAVVGVFLLPDVRFNDPSACLGTTMQFNEDVSKPYEADNALSSYLWNFDDGTASAERFPVKTYTDARVYNVKLTVTTSKNCSASLTKSITVYHNPIADFSAANVCFGDSVRFRDASVSNSGNILQYYWTFGDMESAAVANPAHRYAVAQTYTAGLSVTTEYSCIHHISKIIQIYNNPVADFRADSVCVGNATLFTDYSTAEEGMFAKFNWTFGDASVSVLQHPLHRFSAPQNYTTMLQVETDKGCRDSITHEIVVYPLPIAAFDIVNACDGMPVQFINQSAIDAGVITAFRWNFGDGATSTDVNPAKLYFNAAIYNVELLAISDRMCETRLQKQAVVYKNPIADFLVENVCFNTPVTLTNKSFINNSENLIYHWELGDGYTNGNRELQYTYLQPGTYAVKLTVVSDEGHCIDSMVNTVQIYALPAIDAGNDVSASLGYAVQLSASGGNRYNWSPAEGLSATHISNPLATPKQTTEYTVEGIDEYGCVNYDIVTVFIIDDNRIIPTNLLTPDGNGKNDMWIITNIENYPQALVTVFDLHGKEIFSTRNYQNTWDGRNKTGDILPDGTYYYVITFDVGDRIYKGAITVLRNK
jgi:gliding motility-associated-like protein